MDMEAAAKHAGMTVADLQELAVPTFDLALIALGPCVAAALWWLFYRTRWGV